jgi:PAS domain S-box-containing protein
MIQMADKPTYEELEQRIKEFRKEAVERKKFEEALKESEERYRSLVDNIDFGVTMIDSDHNIVMTNVSQARMFKKPVHEFIGKKCFREYEKRENICPHCPGVQAMSTGHTAHTETEGIRDDGSRFSASINAFPILNEKGHPEGFIEIVEDITERKKAEKALRESEAQYKSLFNNNHSVMLLIDPETADIVDANPAAVSFYGWDYETLTRKKIFNINTLTQEQVFDEIEKAKMEQRKQFFFRHCLASGEIRDVEVYSGPIKVHGKELLYSIVYDITARKKAEEEKAALETQLLHAQKMESIGTLSGGIAHDFNNLLGIILGNAELAMDDMPEWHSAKFNLNEIRTASLRARDVVKQLLSFSRKTDPKQRPVKLVQIVEEALRILRSSIPTSVEIHQNIPNDVEDTILADSTQINQVMINLFTNAAHAMEDTGGVITIGIENIDLDHVSAPIYPDLSPGSYVKLTVSDTGTGIDHEIKDRIFDPYFTTKEVGKGTGIGLSVVHGIIKSHNGAIIVDSQFGKGTTFSIFFPVAEEAVVIEAEPDDEFPTGNERILIVDDEESMADIGRRRLERLGYQVEARTDPREALDLFRADPDQFDLVITDMTMPHITGDNLVKEILNIRPDMPTILCTGFSEKIDEEKAKQIGVREYIEKPIDQGRLSQLVRKVLDHP